MPKFRLGKKKGRAAVPAMPTRPASTAYVDPVRTTDLTVGDYANGIPNIRLGEVFKSFMRQLLWIIPLFAIGVVGSWFLTADFKRSYTGEGTIMVQLGDEYVYQPVAGTTAQSSLMQTPDTITLNEVAIIKNPEVMDKVIAEISQSPGGLKAFSPRIAAKMARHSEGSMGYKLAYMELRKAIDDSFHVSSRPKSSIIDMSFKHEDPQFAVTTLNGLMDAYMDYRRTVFIDVEGDLISQRRADTEAKLKENQRRLQSFLNKNNISDFVSERTGVSTRTEDLRTALNALRADIVQNERSLASVEDQLRQTPATIDLYRDDRASNRIAQAELELQQLLAKYLPDSAPVRQKQAEVESLKALQQASDGRVMGGRRIGPNAVHQDLMRQRNTFQAAADSLREKEVVLQHQLNTADAKVRQLNKLYPAYNDLLREQETLEARLKIFLTEEQEAIIDRQEAETASENVRVISKATYPIKGPNTRLLAFIGASMAWGFTLFMFALFRVFADPRLYVSPTSRASTGGARQSVPDRAPERFQPYVPVAPADQTVVNYPGYEAATSFQEYQPASDWNQAPQPAPQQGQSYYPGQAYESPQGHYPQTGYAQPQPGYESPVDPNNPYQSGQASAAGFGQR